MLIWRQCHWTEITYTRAHVLCVRVRLGAKDSSVHSCVVCKSVLNFKGAKLQSFLCVCFFFSGWCPLWFQCHHARRCERIVPQYQMAPLLDASRNYVLDLVFNPKSKNNWKILPNGTVFHFLPHVYLMINGTKSKLEFLFYFNFFNSCQQKGLRIQSNLLGWEWSHRWFQFKFGPFGLDPEKSSLTACPRAHVRPHNLYGDQSLDCDWLSLKKAALRAPPGPVVLL